MTKTKNTRRALLISVLTMTLSFVMLIGTTFAWFTDTVSSGNNKIVAGNLDVEVTHTNNKVTNEELDAKDAKLFPVELWEPGVVSYETFTVKNVGSLAFDYKFNLNVADFNTVKDTDKSLKDVIKLGVIEKPVGEMTREQLIAAVKAVEAKENSIEMNFTSFSDFSFEDSMQGEKSTKEFTMVAYWEPTENDDDYNMNGNKTVSKLNDGKNELYIDIVVNVVAKQRTFEKDSFNDQYDSGLDYPKLPAVINISLSAQVTSGETTVLKDEDVKVSAIIPDGALSEDVQMVTLKVKTEECKANSVTYEISLLDQDGEKVESSEPIAVNLEIGTGLKNITIKHNGEPMDSNDYSYNPAKGVVTIRTTSFSPFEINFQYVEGWDGSIDNEGLAQNTNVEEKTVYIDTPEQFAAFAKEVNSGNTYLGYTIKLTSDMNLNNISWDPIGDYLSGAYFNGNFDGQGHTIKNLNCESYMAGLFGQSQWKPEGPKQLISNFTVENATIVANNKQGGYGWSAAVVYGSAGPQTDFENITVKGDIIVTTDTKAYYMGGIVGGRSWYGSMNNCHVYANEGSYIECKGDNNLNYTAGLAAWHGEGTKVVIKNSSSNIDIKGVYGTAGLLGIAQYGNIVENCTVGLNEDGTMRRVNISRSITSGDNQDANDIGGIVGMITDDVKSQNVCITNCTGMVHFDIDFGNINHDGVIGNNYSGNDSDIIVITDCKIDWTKKQ